MRRKRRVYYEVSAKGYWFPSKYGRRSWARAYTISKAHNIVRSILQEKDKAYLEKYCYHNGKLRVISYECIKNV